MAVKEKELKKLKLNQLIIDTQAGLTDNTNMNVNHTVTHHGTVYKKGKEGGSFGKSKDKGAGALH